MRRNRHRLPEQDQAVRLDYMGEWHSHPEDFPRPSGTDLRNWLEITVPRKEPMVFMIIGRKDDWIGVSRGVEVVAPGLPDAD